MRSVSPGRCSAKSHPIAVVVCESNGAVLFWGGHHWHAEYADAAIYTPTSARLVAKGLNREIPDRHAEAWQDWGTVEQALLYSDKPDQWSEGIDNTNTSPAQGE